VFAVLTEKKLAGFALAALLADDRALEHVERALPPGLSAAVRAQLALAVPDKALVVAQLLGRTRPALPSLPPLPPRAVALLAPRLPQRPRSALAPAYAGYVPPPGLLPLLLRIARAERAARTGSP
jgi:hypothetical protein